MLTGSLDDLVGRLAYSVASDEGRRPIAFLTGSGISAGAVPMSKSIVELIRRPLSDPDKVAFDEHLKLARDDAERYQQAFQWLSLRRDANYRDRVIQLATLAACDKSGIPEVEYIRRSGDLELATERWRLPDGQSALGRILTGLPAELRGPVLTTNFDPLTEISVRRAGGAVNFFVNADDSSFLGNLRVQNTPFVLHLHGFWRDSATLSTPEQLELHRPTLEASLRYVLEHYTLVVIGYGGWSDVVTRIIQELVAQQRADSLDILWAFYEKPHRVADLVKSFSALTSLAAAPGNVQFYADVDANKFFPRLEKALADHLFYPERQRSDRGDAGLAGWATVNEAFLADYKGLATEESALTFLDGRMPSWQDAVSANVALRESAQELYLRVKRDIPSREASLDLVLGASGEGKSTIAMQFAALAAQDRDFGAQVLYLAGDYFGTDAAVFQLPRDRDHVLVVDDAYRFVPRLQELVTRMKAEARARIHVVAVSRDTDWHNTGANMFAWNSYVRYRHHQVRGISRADATSMVRTWERLGERALGELQTLATSEERVTALLSYSQGLGLDANERTLLGALLTTRYGKGLREHISQLMSRLEGRLIRGSIPGDSLLDALVLIAIPYAYEVLDLEPLVLSDALQLEWPSLVVEVLEPLGDEAAITYSSGRVVVRHEMIASSILDLCLERDYDVKEALQRLVAAAARRVARDGYAPKTGSIAYIAKQITDLPDLAIAAARAARLAVPSRLSYATTLSAVLRRNGDPETARKVNEDAVDLLTNAQNTDQARGYLSEWGVVEGNLGCWARNAILAGLAVQDSASLGMVTRAKVGYASSCLLLALARLEGQQHDDRLIAGIAATSVVVRALGDRSAMIWLREAERVVDRFDGRYPDANDGSAVSADIHAALLVARQRVDKPLPASVPLLSGSFAGLVHCMAGRR